MRIWTVGRQDLTSSKFPFGIFGQRMGGRCQSVSCGCPVLMRGVDRCWCQRCWCQGGARCEGVSCEVSVCEMVVSRRSGRSSRFVRRRCSLNGVVSYKACHRGNDESLSGSGRFLLRLSPVVPVVEASFNLSGPAGQWLAGRQDQKSMWQGFHCRPLYEERL